MDAKRPTPGHNIIKTPKVKDKENLKSSKRKAISYLQGISIRLSVDFSKNLFSLEVIGKKYSKS